MKALAWFALACAAVASVEVTWAHFGGGRPVPVGYGVLPPYAGWLAAWFVGGTIAWLCATQGLVALDLPLARWARKGSDAAWIDGLSVLAFASGLAVRLGVTWDGNGGLDSVPLVYTGPLPWPHHEPGVADAVGALMLTGTVPALFLLVRRWLGSDWARLACALWVTAPMALLGAATHFPGAAAALFGAWALAALERAHDSDAPVTSEAALGACLAMEVAIDLPTGLGFAAALVAVWAWDHRGARLSRAPLLALPAVAAIAVVLWNPPPWPAGSAVDAPAVAGVAVFRVAAESLGWPIALLPALFARSRAGAVCLAASLGVLVPNPLLTDFGPGLYGPERLHLLLVPALLATVAGLAEIRAWNPAPEWGRHLAAMIAAAVLVTAGGYTRVRVEALREVAVHRRTPVAATDRLHDVVVFVPKVGFAAQCPGQSWDLPLDPPVRDDVVWLDHTTLDEDRAAASAYPERKAYRLVWDLETCEARARPLDGPAPGGAPPPR